TQLQRPSEQQDFAQRAFTIAPGSVYVRSFAARDAEAGTKVLDALRSRSGTNIVVEAFEEDSVARQALKRGGFRWQTSKISAGSEIKGIYSCEPLGLPKFEPCDLATLAILKPSFLSAGEHSAILKELSAADFAQHYSDYNKRKSWTAFAI